jgi:hypothetical protein
MDERVLEECEPIKCIECAFCKSYPLLLGTGQVVENVVHICKNKESEHYEKEAAVTNEMGCGKGRKESEQQFNTEKGKREERMAKMEKKIIEVSERNGRCVVVIQTIEYVDLPHDYNTVMNILRLIGYVTPDVEKDIKIERENDEYLPEIPKEFLQ